MSKRNTARIKRGRDGGEMTGNREARRSGHAKIWRPIVAAVLTVGLVLGGLIGASAPAMADDAPTGTTPSTVTADPLPTAQMDGVAWTQAVAGNTVYVGGQFANARPAGAAAGVNTSPRANLMAYNLTTGALVDWNPSANGAVYAMTVSPDGSTLYVGGSFTQISGQARYRLAAFSTATGQLLPWSPGTDTTVNGIATNGRTVWIAGSFSQVLSSARTDVAAVDATTGAVLPFSADVEGGYGVRGIVLSPDGSKVVIAGSFTSVNGSTNPGRGMAALDSTTGASLPWAANSVLRNAGTNAAMYSIASDSDSVYVTGYDFYGTSQDGFEGAARLNWSDGSLVWMEDCHGDSYGIAPVGDVIYTVSHSHLCSNIGDFPQTAPDWTVHRSLAWSKAYQGNVEQPDTVGYRSFTGQPAGTMLHWFPDISAGTYTGQGQGAWTITSAGGYLLLGGEFPTTGGVGQQGLVRYASKAIVGQPKVGPQIPSWQWLLNAYSNHAGQVQLNWGANWDPDNENLTYTVYREGTTAPIYTKTVASNFWTLPTMSYTDTSVTPGQTYRYRVIVTDPDGNSVTGQWTSVTAATSKLTTTYNDDVISAGARHYWPLGDSSTTSADDWAGSSTLTLNGATPGKTGPNLAQPSLATSFNGGATSFGTTTSSEVGPNTFTLEAWFNTTSTTGGKVVSFGNSSTGNSNVYDRQIYLDGKGDVSFGVYSSGAKAITSGSGYNDGKWHYVVGTLSSGGMNLYVDGKLVGNRTDATSAQAIPYGYWRVGGDTINGSWANAGSSGYLSGAISDVAVYDTVLSAQTVNQHWVDSGRTSAIPPAPSDAYGASVYYLGPTLYWRLDDSASGTASDAGMNGNSGTYYGTVAATAGALSGTSDKAVTLTPNGTKQTGVASNSSFTNPQVFTEEAWFKTTSTKGGKIMGFGNAKTGTSGTSDRHIYMGTDGKVYFGVSSGSQQSIQSSSSYNDGKWHHVAAGLSSAGMVLYLDGKQVASNPSVKSAQVYNGYWRVGGDTGWLGATYWQGSVDEAAVYPQALTAAQVLAHYQLGAKGQVDAPPMARFTSKQTDLTMAFDGSGSTDAGGTIASYAWDFGDGTTGTGAKPSHTYASAGTYQVTLTVTDDRGLSASLTQSVTVVKQNVPPVAAFTSTTSGLTATFDGSGSSDPDGTIASYAWDFGDGTTGTGTKPSHTYTTAGSYTVKLTVTDNQGATNSVSHTVTAATANVIAMDGFNRSTTKGWGTADIGGPWTIAGSTSQFGVSNGSATMILNSSDEQEADLASVSSTNTTMSATFSVDKLAAGQFINLIGRQVGSNRYMVRAMPAADGSVQLYILRGENTAIGAGYTVPNLTLTPGTSYTLKLQVTGTSPTSLSAKIWKTSNTEPDWQITRTDSTAGLQTAGSIGVFSWVPKAANAYPTTLTFTNITATDPTK